MRRLFCRKINRYLKQASLADPLPMALAEHLDRCDRCRLIWRGFQPTYQVIRKYAHRHPAPDPDFKAQEALIQRLQNEESERKLRDGRELFPRRIVISCAVGAAALVALASPFFISSVSRTRTFDKPELGSSKTATVAPLRAVPIQIANEAPPAHHSALDDLRTPSISTFSSAYHKPSLGHLAKSKLEPRSGPQPRGVSHTPIILKNSVRNSRESKESSQADDLAYVNAAELNERLKKANRLAETTIHRGDDFVTIPPPEIAAAPSASTNRLIAEAVSRYESEKAVVDPRLFQKVNIEMKGGDLRDLVDALTRKTGVRFYVSKELEDVKLTVLADQTPARDIMRQVVRLFDLEWRRRGEDGKYTYELIQTLKQKLAEEELKRQDDDQMLLNVVDDMEPYLQYKDASQDRIKALAEEAKSQAAVAGSVEERDKLLERQRMLSELSKEKNRDVLHAYSLLTPDQMLALRDGKFIEFVYKGDGSENGLPREWAENLRNAIQKEIPDLNKDKPMEAMTVKIGFRLNRERPDRVDLESHLTVVDQNRVGSAFRSMLLSGQPDRMALPDNASDHVSLKAQPEWLKKETIDPVSGVSQVADESPELQSILKDARSQPGAGDVPVKAKDWIDSADFFSELHKRTGKSIIADYYLRVYPKSTFQSKGEKLLDALDDAGDALKSEWKADDGFLRFRRFDYYSERAMDVPNRLLRKWKADRERDGRLSLDDLSEMAAYPDAVLRHEELTRAAMMKFGLSEWRLAAGARRELLLYASLSPHEKAEIASDAGLPVSELSPDQANQLKSIGELLETLPEEKLSEGSLQLRLTKPGAYDWLDSEKDKITAFPIPSLTDATKENLENRVKGTLQARGFSETEIKKALEHINGPASTLYSQLRIGDRYGLVRYFDYSFWSSNGSIVSPGQAGASTTER